MIWTGVQVLPAARYAADFLQRHESECPLFSISPHTMSFSDVAAQPFMARVQFETVLATPPADRHRYGLSYPSVAQKRGGEDRRGREDLFWGAGPVCSAASELERGNAKFQSELKHGGHRDWQPLTTPQLKLPSFRAMLTTALTELSASPNPDRASKKHLYLQTHAYSPSSSNTTLATPTASSNGSSDSSNSSSYASTPSDENPEPFGMRKEGDVDTMSHSRRLSIQDV
ncbi:hypothetical protein BDW22DRAFT_15212 [Trametopsis cervina]|nr:hypothetical protein BDW22DRAFT_15212 [Trametopsis cervina]